MDTPASQAGRNGALLHMAVSSFPRDLIRGEVVRMWEKKLLQQLYDAVEEMDVDACEGILVDWESQL